MMFALGTLFGIALMIGVCMLIGYILEKYDIQERYHPPGYRYMRQCRNDGCFFRTRYNELIKEKVDRELNEEDKDNESAC